MRIVVMGSGGLGGYFGGISWPRAVWRSRSCRRAAPTLHALQERGLTVRSVNGDLTVPVQACADPGVLPPAGVVLFCVRKCTMPRQQQRSSSQWFIRADDCLDAPKWRGHGGRYLCKRRLGTGVAPGGSHPHWLYACGPWSD